MWINSWHEPTEMKFASTNFLCEDSFHNFRKLGLCEGGSPHCKIIFPTMKNNSVVYTISESDYQGEIEFKYKLFLGDVSFLNDKTYVLSMKIASISGNLIVVMLIA